MMRHALHLHRPGQGLPFRVSLQYIGLPGSVSVECQHAQTLFVMKGLISKTEASWFEQHAASGVSQLQDCS